MSYEPPNNTYADLFWLKKVKDLVILLKLFFSRRPLGEPVELRCGGRVQGLCHPLEQADPTLPCFIKRLRCDVGWPRFST